MLTHFPDPFSHFNCRRRIQSRSGMTLVELLIACLLGIIVLGTVVVTMLFVNKSMVMVQNYYDLDRASRQTLDTMSRDIRNAIAMTYPAGKTTFVTNEIDFVGTNLAGGTFAYSYVWNPANSALIRTFNGASKVMLTNCDYLSFGVYTRNPGPNLTFTNTSITNTAKLIDVTWHCWKPILGKTNFTTESVQTAKIVIRN